MTIGGTAAPVIVSTDPPSGGAALPVAVVSSAPVAAGPAQPVYVVSAAQLASGAFRLAAGPAQPVVAVSGRPATAGRPIAVYAVSGSFAGSSANPDAYPLLRDMFTDTDAAPLASPRVAVPGAGTWTVTDTSTPKVLYTNGTNYLRLQQAGVTIGTSVDLGWGAAALISASFARVAGRAFVAVIHVEDETSDFALHWSTSGAAGDPSADGHGWKLDSNGYLVAISNSVRSVVSGRTGARNTIRPMQYLAAVVLQASGAYVLLSTFGTDPGLSGNSDDPVGIPQYPLARLVWAEQSGTVTPLYPAMQFKKIHNYPGGHAIADARVLDLPDAAYTTANGLATARDTFTRANSATSLGTADVGGAWTVDGGTWGISSNQAYQPGNTGFTRAWVPGLADGVVEADITVGASKNVGLMVRRVDASNFIRVWLNGGNSIAIQTWVAGGFGATIVTTGYTFTVGQTYRIRVAFQGNKYQAWVNGVNIYGAWQTDSNNRHLTGTGCGLYAVNDNGGSRWDNFAVWPHTTTLPADLQAGAAPLVLTPGATLASDTFTDADGTALTAHTPTSGPAWTAPFGTWAIQSNALAGTGTGAPATKARYALQTLNVADVECSISITQPNPLGSYVFAGIIAYVDSSNYVVVRLAQDVVNQPNDQEIEIDYLLSGAASVVHKVQFGVAYPAGSTHTLKVQFSGNVILVCFDDAPRESFILPAALTARVAYGPYSNEDGNTATFDGWVVKAL